MAPPGARKVGFMSIAATHHLPAVLGHLVTLIAQRENGETTPARAPTAPDRQICKEPNGSNEFEVCLEGSNPELEVGGSPDQREHQRDVTLRLAWHAFESYMTGHTPFTPRVPTDSQVQGILHGLERNPPIGKDGAEVTRATYRSHIPNASAEEAYRHFVENPGEVFGAGGMEIRPSSGPLENGGRYMLEAGGPPPVWLPVEITLQPADNAITIHTLDGHPLRGEQTFTFKDDGVGGTTLTQEARFQASSNLVGEVQQVASLSKGQHVAWEHAHREIHRQFNGDPGYEGIGTSIWSPELWKSGLQAVGAAISDPGKATDAGFDAAGVVVNAGYDKAGTGADRVLDRMGIPGGDVVERGFDKVGDAAEEVWNKIGDAAKAGVNILGGR
jgi:hypothetical protein